MQRNDIKEMNLMIASMNKMITLSLVRPIIGVNEELDVNKLQAELWSFRNDFEEFIMIFNQGVELLKELLERGEFTDSEIVLENSLEFKARLEQYLYEEVSTQEGI